MAYQLGGPKRIEDEGSGIVFHVAAPWGLVSEIDRKSREVLTDLLKVERIADDVDRAVAEVDAQQRHHEVQELYLGLIQGWEGVVDEDGEPVPYSREALEQLDVAILEDVLKRLRERGQQRARERESKN